MPLATNNAKWCGCEIITVIEGDAWSPTPCLPSRWTLNFSMYRFRWIIKDLQSNICRLPWHYFNIYRDKVQDHHWKIAAIMVDQNPWSLGFVKIVDFLTSGCGWPALWTIISCAWTSDLDLKYLRVSALVWVMGSLDDALLLLCT